MQIGMHRHLQEEQTGICKIGSSLIAAAVIPSKASSEV
jgi:hypothetical protein